ETKDRVPGTGAIGGIAVDRFGYVYVANFDLGVWRVAPGGEVEQIGDGFYGSSGNTVLPNGDLLQANWLANSIVRIDRAGNMHPFVSEGLTGPVGLTRAPDGSIYVANYLGNSISKVTPGGEVTEFLKHERLKGPNSIVTDKDGNLYTVGMNDNAVLKISPDAEVEIIATLPGNSNAHLALLNDALYVTKIWDHVVMKVDMDGNYEVIAGDGIKGFRDGDASQIAYPNAIAAGRSFLYMNNLNGNMQNGEKADIVIRRIYPPHPYYKFKRVFDDGGIATLRRTYRAARASDAFNAEQITGGAYRLLNYFVQVGEKEAATNLVSWLLQDDENKMRANFEAGNTYALIGSRQQAVTHYKRALEIEPENTEVQLRLQGVEAFRKN
ncbi:MAG: hypothetical protein MJA83_19390, partial [Gammaproteobacteria bacterium]|nr:hypothetical protein [Gammaproteobacteria bacterium]